MIGWIILGAWCLCWIQSLRIIAGFVYDEFGPDLDGNDYFGIVFFGILLSTIVGPAIVLIRFIYWAWHYFELSGKVGDPFKVIAVNMDVETRVQKKERKLRESRNEVRELRAKLAEREYSSR